MLVCAPALAIMLTAPGHAASAGPAGTFDVEQATRAWLATLHGAARARSDAYFDGRIVVDLAGGLLGVVVCWLIVRLRLLVWLRTRMERGGWRPWTVILACAALFLLAQAALMAPFTVYADFWRERQFGLMNQTFAGWLGDQAITTALGVVVGSVVLLAIMAVIRAAPRRWWLLGAGLMGVVFLAAAMVFPVFVAPLFNTYTELPDGPVRARIVAMARAHGVPAQHVYLADESRQSDRISANVSGLGPTVRITLNDNLLRQAGPPEVAAVMGHELGHYVLHHQVLSVAAFSALTAVLLWLIARIQPALIRARARRWGLRDSADPAAIPVLVGVYAALALLATPVQNAIVRSSENAADGFGLDAAREPDGFAATAMRLSRYRKIDPPAWEEVLFFDHPSGATRVRRAMQWKKDHVPGATAIVPPPLPDDGPYPAP